MAKLARKEGGHSCPPNGGLEKPPSVGDAVQTELGRLPAGWRVMPIREAYSFTRKPRGMVIPRDGSIPFLPMDLIPIGRVSVSEYEERPGSRLTSGTYIENGDLLVAKITPSFENGKQAIVQWDRPFGFATTEVIPIQEIEGVSDKNYLFHVLLHPVIRSDLAGKMDGTTGRQRLSKEVLGSQVITLPPLAEQRKIAGVLGLVQRAMEQQERLIALTTELKKALLHQLFTQGLRGEPQKQTEIGPVPQSWEVKRLEEVATIIMGQSPDGDSYNTNGNGVPLINGPVEFGPGALSKTLEVKFTTEPTKFCADSDLILCVRGSTTGRTNVANGRACIGRGVAAIRAEECQEYLSQFMVSIRDRIYSMGTGTTFPNISGSQIKEILVPVPPPKVQEEIGGILRTVDRKHELFKRKYAALTALFRTLLHELMTAQIRVHDLDLSELCQEGKAEMPCGSA